MRKRLIALMLMAVFAFEQTNVLTAFAEEYDYMPIYDKDGNTVNVEDALSSRDAGNYVTIYDSAGNEVNIDDVVAEAAEKNKTNDSSSSSEYTPIYDELGNEVNPVDVLASEKTGINIPIYDENGNTINPIDLEGKLYDLYGSEFRYIKVYDEAGNEIDWCGLLNNVEEWNARGFYTVTYVDSFDNSVIDTIVVPKDTSVTQIPTPPVHENYTFLTWVGNSNNVQKNETVTAVYLESTPRLDLFGYVNDLNDFIEFYVYGTRTNYDGVLTSDLSKVNLKLSDYTWTDDEGRVFTPDEEGNFINSQTGNKFSIYSKSKVPDITTDTSVSIVTDDGNIVATDDEKIKDLEALAVSSAKTAVKDTTKACIKALTKSLGVDPLSGAFEKLILGVLGLQGEDDTSKIIDEIKEVDKNLKKAEQELKLQTLNVAEFTTQASKIQEVVGASQALEHRIDGIMVDYNRGEIDAARRDMEIAALYDRPAWDQLDTALNNATSVFETGNPSAYNGDSIIMKAYKLECNNVMFSKEAEVAITPYVLRQMSVYLRGYAVQNMILDACEKTKYDAVGVANARKVMLERTGGIVDGKFNPNSEGIITNFYTFVNNNSDFILVNKSQDPTQHIALKGEIDIYNGENDCYKYETRGRGRHSSGVTVTVWSLPKEITNYTLSEEQVKAIADYCTAKGYKISDYLFDKVGFTCGKGIDEATNVTIDAAVKMLSYSPLIKGTDSEIRTGIFKSSYILAGPHAKGKDDFTSYYFNAVEINKKGANIEKAEFYNHWNRNKTNYTILIFQRQ
ncbi:MAG: hypothetical protein IJJ59_13330 [Pseudobutyrivibrio sp.]|uniref:hypothetical protein n=1 Tax=Pseudobutyrivibrio sp. TaxID=2014367 RepID=UPI0025D96238|nr:hypothetical protein [Pseudobutyrivibrio sp.]MBQ6464302.1 hypothetical protein [Pseudobutyrivibrio sp.]